MVPDQLPAGDVTAVGCMGVGTDGPDPPQPATIDTRTASDASRTFTARRARHTCRVPAQHLAAVGERSDRMGTAGILAQPFTG